MIFIVGPLLIGAVVGWSIYFFMRLYRRFAPQVLLMTLLGISGGPVLSFIEKWTTGQALKIDTAFWYFAGVALGFFIYALYVGAISYLFATGRIKNRIKLEELRGCGAGMGVELEEVERLMAFEELMQRWQRKDIDDESLKLALRGSDFTQVDYRKLVALPLDDHEVPKECIARFTEMKLYEVLKKR